MTKTRRPQKGKGKKKIRPVPEYSPKVEEVFARADAHKRKMREENPKLFGATEEEKLSDQPLPEEECGLDKMVDLALPKTEGELLPGEILP